MHKLQSLSILQRYGLYALVLIAVALLVFIVINLIQTVLLEHSDKKKKTVNSECKANNIYYFIARSTFQQIQLSSGILTSGSLISILLFCKVFNPLILISAGCVIFIIGIIIPYLYFAQKAKKRAEIFENSILELSMGLTSGLRAGQALPQALEVFSRRCDQGPLKDELLIAIRDYRLGLELTDALQRMYDRLPCEDLQLLIISIKLTTQSGGSLTDVLRKITQMIRGRSEFQQKLNALTAQGKFEALAMSLAPLLAFVLLFLINNELMLPMVKSLIGWAAIGIMLLLEVVGYVVIRAIVDIKV